MAAPSFAFVPRKFAKSAKPQSTPGARLSPVPAPALVPADELPSTSANASTTLPAVSDADLALLAALTFSDHALWADPALLRAVTDGYIPLSALLKRPPLYGHHREPAVARALRASDARIDVRLRVGQHTQGEYEVRRTDWDATSEYSDEYWDARTLYMENIPPAHRSVAGIARLVISLFPPSSPQSVQSVVLPPHHRDAPGVPPKCRGYALVALGDAAAATALVRSWPWERRVAGDADTPIVREAARFGLRMLPVGRWRELQAEYLAHRERLLAELAASADEAAEVVPEELPEAPPAALPRAPPAAPSEPWGAAAYPRGCLVFVRHVDPGTNKTALRAAFADALGAPEGVDYIDFSKGMDTCHVRVARAADAGALAARFGAGGGGMVAEVVEGRREAVYWEKVPERVRMEAVRRAEGSGAAAEGAEEGETRRKRRRR